MAGQGVDGRDAAVPSRSRVVAGLSPVLTQPSPFCRRPPLQERRVLMEKVLSVREHYAGALDKVRCAGKTADAPRPHECVSVV